MDYTKLAKVLALASSSNDSEARSALRRAHELLARSGATFVDLAEMLQKAQRPEDLQVLKTQILGLKRENRRLKRELGGIDGGTKAATAPTSEQKRALANEIQARREAEAALAKAVERSMYIERLWRRTAQKRRETGHELQSANAQISELTAKLDNLQVQIRRLKARLRRFERKEG